MSFANVQDLEGYVRLLSQNECKVRVAEDTERFPLDSTMTFSRQSGFELTYS
jgi:hypothetical protein